MQLPSMSNLPHQVFLIISSEFLCQLKSCLAGQQFDGFVYPLVGLDNNNDMYVCGTTGVERKIIIHRTRVTLLAYLCLLRYILRYFHIRTRIHANIQQTREQLVMVYSQTVNLSKCKDTCEHLLLSLEYDNIGASPHCSFCCHWLVEIKLVTSFYIIIVALLLQ